MAPDLRFGLAMKMLSDYQGIDLTKVGFRPELKKLHTAAESLVLAMRYVAIQVRDEEKLETLLRKVAFIDEIRGEIKDAALRGTNESVANQLPQWAFELSLVSEEGDMENIHDFLDSLFRCFAEASVWLCQMVEEDPEQPRRSRLDHTYRKLIDFVGCGSLAIVSGSHTTFDNRVA